MTDPFRLDGKVALVTGGSRGIGKAIALALAEAGADVALTCRTRQSAADAAAAAIRDKGRRALALTADVRDRAAVRAAIERTATELGGLDVVVNNAGVNQPTDFDQVTDEAWDEILGVNLKGPFVVSQEALPFLRRRGGGSIVMVGSVSGQYGGPRTAHYAASKAGLVSLAQVIARFGAKDGVRCNTVAAGLIASEMAQAGLSSATVQKAAEGIVLRRLGTMDEVARAVVFLASEASSYVTAQTLNVNGGLYF